MLSVLASYRRSLGFLFKHNLGWFLWFPVLITFLVLFGGFSLTSWATKQVSDTIDIWLSSIDILPEWASFVQDIIYWILWLVMRVILYFAFAFFGGTIILLLMAPILTWLSERIAVALDKDVPEFNITQFMQDLTRAIGLAIKNGMIQLALSVLCFVIGLIPVVGAVSPLLLILVNSYFYGYNFMDYSLERRHTSISESNRFVWNHRVKASSIGAPFAIWMLVPFIGPLTAGFFAVFSTIAATMEIEQLLEGK